MSVSGIVSVNYRMSKALASDCIVPIFFMIFSITNVSM